MKELKNFSAENGDITDRDVVEQAVNKYKDKDELELVSELEKAVARAKADGSFDREAIDNFARLVSPYLSDEQREKLDNLFAVIESK